MEILFKINEILQINKWMTLELWDRFNRNTKIIGIPERQDENPYEIMVIKVIIAEKFPEGKVHVTTSWIPKDYQLKETQIKAP